MSKLKTLAIFTAGYVLGAQAGRSRYEEIKRQATRVAEHPRTQQLVQTARDQAASRLPASVSSRWGGAQPATTLSAGTSAGTSADSWADESSDLGGSRPSHL